MRPLVFGLPFALAIEVPGHLARELPPAVRALPPALQAAHAISASRRFSFSQECLTRYRAYLGWQGGRAPIPHTLAADGPMPNFLRIWDLAMEHQHSRSAGLRRLPTQVSAFRFRSLPGDARAERATACPRACSAFDRSSA